MPQPKAPPTPSASTDLTAKDRTIDRDMEGVFTLPPPAVQKKSTPPVSPIQRPMVASSPRHKRTISGATKSKEDLSIPQYDLPPPPSRARKIIQMKPKSSNSSSSEASQPTTCPPKSNHKRKQPSATSAAGRKIARKTAHSIIERRRRSKMNEEFGVLKDMIPACEGVEMHKLAILQAGIEYVRYLEGCIRQLKGEREAEDIDDEDDEEVAVPLKRIATNSTTDWQYRKASTASSSTNPSPDIRPQQQLEQPSHRPVLPNIPSFAASPGPTPYSTTHSATPTPTLLSPAFSGIHFSPDLSRTGTNSTATSISLLNASPHILPLPQISLDRGANASPATMSEGAAEATATAALMMLTKDRRNAMEGKKGNGMSVRELLSS